MDLGESSTITDFTPRFNLEKVNKNPWQWGWPGNNAKCLADNMAQQWDHYPQVCRLQVISWLYNTDPTTKQGCEKAKKTHLIQKFVVV